jgi:hypothetical protein
MDEKGLFVIYLEKLFGKSWRTSLYGVLSVLPQIFNCFQDFFINLGVKPVTLNSISLLFLALAALEAKGQNVTGKNRDSGTGEPGVK